MYNNIELKKKIWLIITKFIITIMLYSGDLEKYVLIKL